MDRQLRARADKSAVCAVNRHLRELFRHGSSGRCEARGGTDEFVTDVRGDAGPEVEAEGFCHGRSDPMRGQRLRWKYFVMEVRDRCETRG